MVLAVVVVAAFLVVFGAGETATDATGLAPADGVTDGLTEGFTEGLATGGAAGTTAAAAALGVPSTAPSLPRIIATFGAGTMPSARARAARACGACSAAICSSSA